MGNDIDLRSGLLPLGAAQAALPSGASRREDASPTPTKFKRRPKDQLLPGDLRGESYIDRVIRVDHAGEFGAKRIYEGQLQFTTDPHLREEISHMYKQELEHLEKFSKLLNERKMKPTAFIPLWNAAGFAMGAATALLGEKAAMACTVAVEEVIDGHYLKQWEKVPDGDLKDTIEKFRNEEIGHIAIASKHKPQEAPLYPVLSGIVKAASKAAIWLSERA